MTNIYSNTSKWAINHKMVLKILGQLLMVESAFMLLPLIACIIDQNVDLLAFIVAVVVTSGTGAALNFKIKPEHEFLSRRDGMILAAVTWIAFSIFGMLPFLICHTPLNIHESFFEAMSGFTTTGATVIRDVEQCGMGVLLWRALTQWIGGLGIVLFTLMFIPSLNNNVSLMMFHAEATGITHDKLGARISKTAKKLWGIYTIITIALILMLWGGPMTLFESICHGLAGISTGGFSTQNEGIAAFNSPYIKSVLIIFMFIGGVSFGLIINATRNGWKVFWRNDVFRTFIWTISIFYVLMVAAIIKTDHFTGWQSITIDPLFHIVSAMTSTGFSAGDWEAWGIQVLTLTFVMMYVGACAGSTTGGAKIDRLLYLLKNFQYVVRKYVRPRLLKSVSVNGQTVEQGQRDEIIAFIFIYTLLIIIGGMVLIAQDFPIVDAFFSAFSCVSNNGLGAGLTGSTGSFDFLPPFGKWVMSFLMLAGRLEIITFFAIFVPAFWRK
ncbi:MAG: TrkH family potassium uptake protein [Bacteroidales bacterium]|nr:TrkH family potassium uptake protein [Bacteroidales bacterium]